MRRGDIVHNYANPEGEWNRSGPFWEPLLKQATKDIMADMREEKKRDLADWLEWRVLIISIRSEDMRRAFGRGRKAGFKNWLEWRIKLRYRDYGKIYGLIDDKYYYRDGAGIEHECSLNGKPFISLADNFEKTEE